MTLLDKALAQQTAYRKKEINDETAELAVAWLRGQVSQPQIRKAMGIKSTSPIYVLLALSLKHAWDSGLLTVPKRPKHTEVA